MDSLPDCQSVSVSSVHGNGVRRQGMREIFGTADWVRQDLANMRNGLSVNHDVAGSEAER